MGAEAARHTVDPVGRVHRTQSRGLPLFPRLRAVLRLGKARKLSVTMRQTHLGGDKRLRRLSMLLRLNDLRRPAAPDCSFSQKPVGAAGWSLIAGK
jgi:hypothetical protein